MFTEALRQQAADLLDTCRGKGLKLAIAESCTGGLVSALLTEIPGSSDIVERGFVTYSNQSKTELLGVNAETIAVFGAVSREVATAMAHGALTRAHVDIAVAITGVAGPGGGSAEKPVGLVFIAVAARDHLHVEENRFGGDRSTIRLQSVEKALDMLQTALTRSFVSLA